MWQQTDEHIMLDPTWWRALATADKDRDTTKHGSKLTKNARHSKRKLEHNKTLQQIDDHSTSEKTQRTVQQTKTGTQPSTLTTADKDRDTTKYSSEPTTTSR